MSAEHCATCGQPASGWVGTGDAPDKPADAKGRVWLCDRCITPLWRTAISGYRAPLPGQTRLFA